MLAKLGEPFDSEQHLFEIKWDGMRAMAHVGAGASLRLVNRHRHELAGHFPELSFLVELEPGVVIDGELIVAAGPKGKPDFGAIMRRRHAKSPVTVQSLARQSPASFVAFDLLYRRFRPVFEQPLQERRAQLAEVVGACERPDLVFSDGVIGNGHALFQQVCAEELEGIVAKRLDSTYRPGARTETWVKIKRRQTAVCLILGYLPDGEHDFRSLIIAMDDGGTLRAVGQVGGGIREAQRRRLNELLRQRPRAEPLVSTDAAGKWVEPGLYCTVTYLERTVHGGLRGPVFVDLLEED